MTPIPLIDRQVGRLAPGSGRVGVLRGGRSARLLPSGDGWSLIGPDGALMFSALGYSGRQRCLEFARAAGLLALRP